jgi:cell division protein FtsW (lipid II flippase)
MDYFKNLLKNIDKVLLFLPVCFAVISIIMVGSTSYEGHFIITKDIIVQASAYIIGVVALCIVLLLITKHLKAWKKFYMPPRSFFF